MTSRLPKLDAATNATAMRSVESLYRKAHRQAYGFLDRCFGIQSVSTERWARSMKARKTGRIINISSQAGRSKSEIRNLPYANAKAELLGFIHQFAQEFGPYGIAVNTLAPGLILNEASRSDGVATANRTVGR